MRLSLLAAGLLLLVTVLLLAESAGAARSRFSYRSRVRFRIGRSGRYSSYTYHGPLYTRRLSPSLMGPVYYGYASRYPMHFSYRRGSAARSGDVCTNDLALSNGSYIGTFHCPFLPDEPSSWTRCCGFHDEGFCCDRDYDDSWKLAVGLSAIAIVAIIGGCLLALGLLIGLIFYCCCCSKKHSGNGGASFGAGAAAAGGKEPPISVLNPVKPPYPTMEYGTVQPPTDGSPGSAPYPPQQPPPYPPPYSAQS